MPRESIRTVSISPSLSVLTIQVPFVNSLSQIMCRAAGDTQQAWIVARTIYKFSLLRTEESSLERIRLTSQFLQKNYKLIYPIWSSQISKILLLYFYYLNLQLLIRQVLILLIIWMQKSLQQSIQNLLQLLQKQFRKSQLTKILDSNLLRAYSEYQNLLS